MWATTSTTTTATPSCWSACFDLRSSCCGRRENPPESVDINLLGREISITEPRVTKVPIEWDDVVEDGAGMGVVAEGEGEGGIPQGLLEEENSRSLGVE